jgi:hypothetical protein
MKVSCISNNISSKNSPPSIVEWANNTELEITVGETYTVLAITKLFGVIFYYILSDASDEYPLSFPCYLFKIENSKISKYWHTSLDKVEDLESIKIGNGDVISFIEWSSNKDMFYENLLEGNQNEVRLFSEYKHKILHE